MTKLSLKELEVFLREKPGYLKEGALRLKNHLNNSGFDITERTCLQGLQNVRKELKYKPTLEVQPKVLFYDIEVSYGLARAWRPTYKGRISYEDFKVHPKIICISWKWGDSDEIHTVQWDSNHDDKTLLEVFIPVLNEADFIVAHNGDRFDLPWIKARALVHGLEMHPTYPSVDTLKIAKYDFRFPSNRLADLSDYLGLEHAKIKTEMELWDKVFEGDEEALEEMIVYCEMDVQVLEDVYNTLTQMTLPKVHVGTMNDELKCTSPYTGKKNIEAVKKVTSRRGTIKWLMKDLDTGLFFEMSNTEYKKHKLLK